MVSTSIPSIQEKQRIIHLTEVSAVNYPESADYRYKCKLQVLGNDGKPLLQKDLLTRTQPSWLLDLKNKGDCRINMTLLSRKGDISQPWEEVGKVSFTTEEVLNGQRSKELEFAVNNWDAAPDLKLQARLTQSTSEGTSSNLNILNNQSHKITKQYQRRVEDNQKNVEVEIPEAVELSSQEEVIVKDVFNKLRAFKELAMDLFFERLLLEMPELIDIYGDGIDGVRDYFYELF
ncbi:MAG: nitric-oxide synthase, partial [Cyanobacteria bacterium J06573_2]